MLALKCDLNNPILVSLALIHWYLCFLLPAVPARNSNSWDEEFLNCSDNVILLGDKGGKEPGRKEVKNKNNHTHPLHFNFSPQWSWQVNITHTYNADRAGPVLPLYLAQERSKYGLKLQNLNLDPDFQHPKIDRRSSHRFWFSPS